MAENNLPVEFLAMMRSLLGEEFEPFQASYEDERAPGLRVNGLKLSASELQQLVPWQLEPIPWCAAGFYYAPADQPGKHPFHAAGLYYLQEPSAMAVAELAAPRPGERVLDLCAAPGGKATHLAAQLQGEGFLLANEIHPQRAKVLAENLERWGARNALISSAPAEELVRRFGAWFDCVVVDAPCSGEGMFRKDPEARRQWNPGAVSSCAATQRALLEAAYQLLAPGGRLVYSTCTFSLEENEANVATLLQRHPDLQLQSARLHPLWQPGYAVPDGADTTLTARLWPHRLRGEGHFLALLVKAADGEAHRGGWRDEERGLYTRPDPELAAFAAENLTVQPSGPFLRFGQFVYQAAQEQLPALQGLRVLRPGWALGEVRRGRFIPAHGLALGLRAGDVQRVHDLEPESAAVLAYLRGQTLSTDLANGWALVTVAGFPLGWGKAVGGVLKNHYPKGLRWF